MRYGEDVAAVDAVDALLLQAVPELPDVRERVVQGSFGLDVRIGHSGQVDRGDGPLDHLVVAEDDVAMPVRSRRRRGILVGDKAGERAVLGAVVGFLGRGLHLRPHRKLGGVTVTAPGFAQGQARVAARRRDVRHAQDRESAGSRVAHERGDRCGLRVPVEAVQQATLQRQAAGRVRSEKILADADLAEQLRMVGDRPEIERHVDLDLAGLLPQRAGQDQAALTLGELVDVPGPGLDEADAPVERQPRVEMGRAEERLSEDLVAGATLPLLGAHERGLGNLGRQHEQHNYAQANRTCGLHD